jgi:hypothetical protein
MQFIITIGPLRQASYFMNGHYSEIYCMPSDGKVTTITIGDCKELLRFFMDVS